jgi:hypothetical protein
VLKIKITQRHMPVIPVLGSQRQEDRKFKTIWAQWLKPIILATQKTEIKRIGVQSRPWEIVHKTLSQKYQTPKKGWFKSPVPL